MYALCNIFLDFLHEGVTSIQQRHYIQARRFKSFPRCIFFISVRKPAKHSLVRPNASFVMKSVQASSQRNDFVSHAGLDAVIFLPMSWRKFRLGFVGAKRGAYSFSGSMTATNFQGSNILQGCKLYQSQPSPSPFPRWSAEYSFYKGCFIFIHGLSWLPLRNRINSHNAYSEILRVTLIYISRSQ